jgi:hypothetical protein
MKQSVYSIASARRVAPGATVIALLHFGMAACIVMPLSSRAQSVGPVALPASMLYVDCAAVSQSTIG